MFWRGFETDSEKLTIDCQYAIENNHGSNGYHGCLDNDEIRMSNDEAQMCLR